jgi:hypothetical protein
LNLSDINKINSLFNCILIIISCYTPLDPRQSNITRA